MTLKFNGIADAYLEWAVHTQFEGFADAAAIAGNQRAGLIASRHFQPKVEDVQLNDWWMAPLYEDSKRTFVAGSWPIEKLLASGAHSQLSQWFDQIELASAVCEPIHVKTWISGVYPKWESRGDVVIGCIDDAFPIANPAYFHAGNSRVLRIWDQGKTPNDIWSALGNPQLGLDPTTFGYGAELVNPANLVGTPKPNYVGSLPQSTGLEGDTSYYEHVGMQQLRHHGTHGAMVLDALAGPLSVEDRLKRKVAPTDDQASRAPLVLVQLPQAAKNDPSGRWLGRHVLDGIHYILQAAGVAKTVVINISWGPQTGPHDGESLLEKAMANLVAKWAGDGKNLHIVLPAGNSFQLRAHAQFRANEGCTDLVWVVPPDRRTASFLEVWWANDQTAADITVVAPDGSPLNLSTEGITTSRSSSGVIRWGITLVKRVGRTMALIAVQPGARLHGQWKITVHEAEDHQGDVHVYVARSDPNMGAPRHDQASYLLDPVYENALRQRDGLTMADDDPRMVRGKVKRQGTLSGIATGDGVFVAGASRYSDGQPAPYTSSGPGVNGGRKYPEYAPPGDESKGLPGVLVGAVRAGSVVRLQGTSVAAPQLARQLANGVIPARLNQRPWVADLRTGRGWWV